MTERNKISIYAEHATAWWSGEQRFLRLLARMVPARMRYFDGVIDSWDGLSVVDVGCGGGFMAEAVAQRGARVIGVDPVEPALDAARRHARDLGLRIDYREGRAEALPLDSGVADVVLCVDVLEHVDDLDKALSEAARVLRPGGTLLYDTINRTWLARLVIVHIAEGMLRWLPGGTHDPARFIRPDELRARLSALGFDVSPMVGLGPVRPTATFEVAFGRLPTKQILYMGHAVRLL